MNRIPPHGRFGRETPIGAGAGRPRERWLGSSILLHRGVSHGGHPVPFFRGRLPGSQPSSRG
jgi:hypothetical protein